MILKDLGIMVSALWADETPKGDGLVFVQLKEQAMRAHPVLPVRSPPPEPDQATPPPSSDFTRPLFVYVWDAGFAVDNCYFSLLVKFRL